MARRDIVAIGGSTGSTAALCRILADLPPGLAATLLLVTHVPANSGGYLAEALNRKGHLPVHQAADGQPLEQGRVYVAPPDRHMLVNGEAILLGTGPREHMARPAIDPLFRSAALAFGPRVIGVVLTGLLNDGAAGLHAIKAAGGLAVVQHPLDAEAGDMPLAALRAVEVDHVARADELGGLIARLVETRASPARPSPDELTLEVEIAAGRRLGPGGLQTLAEPAALTCPQCHGTLSEAKEAGPLRHRCPAGSVSTSEALGLAPQEGIEEALRMAMRMMEERTELIGHMVREAREAGREAVAVLYEARAAEYARHAATLRRAATQGLRPARAGTNDI